MTTGQLQELCARGQDLLQQTDYLAAETVLVQAETVALKLRDYDTLARLYMPLQEARRQRRLRCAEGLVVLDLISTGVGDNVDAQRIIEHYPHGQLLVAGWGSIEPAMHVRRIAQEQNLYVETFLGAVYPTGNGRVVVLVPTADVKLPDPENRPIDKLLTMLPAHSIVLREDQILDGPIKSTPQTFALISSLWEQLHAPFLAAAEMQVDPVKKIEHYRKTIRVDYACELAHQNLSATAANLARSMRPAVEGPH